MSQQFIPPIRAHLIDGRELRVERDGVHVGERIHPLAAIQEARLLFLRPETIGLRMADVGQVEYSFARQGDGAAALEALYQLRPDLRSGETPALEAPPGYFAPVAPAPPLAPQPLAPPFTPPMAQQLPRQIGPTPFPPSALEAYGPEPNQTYAELTPVPRTASQLIGSAFRLFGKRFGALVALALVIATLPTAAVAALEAVVSALSGVNPLAGAPNPLDTLQQVMNGQTTASTAPTAAPTSLDAIISLLSLAAVVLSLLVAAWSQAALTVGAREAALGRLVSVRACVREGATRLWPTLWALFFLYGVLGIIAIPGFGLALALLLAPHQKSTSAQFTAQEATAFAIVAGVIAAAIILVLAYLWTRLALYPTAAALGLPQPLRQSISLTSFGWRRVFWSLLVVTLAASLLTIPASAAQLLSVAVATIALAPLAQLIAGPLGALIRVVTLYDQRLRREGYALFQREGVPIPLAASVSVAPERGPEASG